MNKATPYRTCKDCKFYYKIPRAKRIVGYTKSSYKNVCFKHKCGVGVYQKVCEEFVYFEGKDVQ